MTKLAYVLALVVSSGTIAKVEAQTYPSRPITLLVPPTAGRTTEVLARILADPMTTLLGQAVVVERASSGGHADYRPVPHAPDGYTLEIGNLSTHRYTMYGRSYDLQGDFMPVALLPSVPAWIVARKELLAPDLKELTAWLKNNSEKVLPGTIGSGAPGKASAGIVDSGAPGHICLIQLQNVVATRIQFVPYWNDTSMLQGLMRGQIDFACDQATNSLGAVRGGRIKTYAIMAKARWFMIPDIPTADEIGLSGIYVSYWHGFWVPKGTPNDIISKLNLAAVDAMTDPAVRRRIADEGMEIPPRDQQTPAALDAFQRAEMTKWCEAMVGKAGPYIAVLPHCGGRRADAN
jgi:tripartite-type tricarboxylate transporter receptor subunit TctC